ncbi:hypothetical protein FisN_18Lh266 [Fistulifera solaris]|uniref:Replication factor A3 n=1 Tax=Fistulifera solaris TaxID=1519565 RepID=A0A1Z5JV34_FISSO|nr:hypothetical protein FisN_18Lh266 [Fistulifera solaris]|eukprot:GAX17611.1 hypothetical protein FisN_18Lh266 [Fistulifera solaris]
MAAQPDGYYPRVNAATLGQHVDMIVSVVGKIASPVGSIVQMQCADGGMIHLSTEHGDLPIDLSSEMVVEVIGQVNSPQEVALFVTRELSTDTDLETYNRMLMVQAKFPQYFAPVVVEQ